MWPIGTPNAAQKRDYTLVLKGTLSLSRARFPKGTLAPMLDALARPRCGPRASTSGMARATVWAIS